jgi:hypothetical protein
VARLRLTAIAALSALALAASAAGAAQTHPSTLAATKACLDRLPDTVAGLPPATPPRTTPPAAPALFVDRLTAPSYPVRVKDQLGAWQGRKGSWEGVTISFFPTVQAARAALKQLVSLEGGEIVANTVLAWDQKSGPSASLRRALLGCLGVPAPAGGTSATNAVPAAGLATFAGEWGGHTRGLKISSAGQGQEGVDDGCCYREYRMTFQILSVSGTLTNATASFRVTSFKRYDTSIPSVQSGQTGTLQLKNGILDNTLTKVFYCSDPAWGATGACGA